jgi:hypothetical protein
MVDALLATCALLLALLFAPSFTTGELGAQVPVPADTVTITRRVLVTGDLTPVSARRQALEQTVAEAVRRLRGVRVQSAQLGVDEDRDGRVRDSFLSVVQLDAAGRATDYRVLAERFVTEQHPVLGAQLYLELRARDDPARSARDRVRRLRGTSPLAVIPDSRFPIPDSR